MGSRTDAASGVTRSDPCPDKDGSRVAEGRCWTAETGWSAACRNFGAVNGSSVPETAGGGVIAVGEMTGFGGGAVGDGARGDGALGDGALGDGALGGGAIGVGAVGGGALGGGAFGDSWRAAAGEPATSAGGAAGCCSIG